MRKSLIVNVFFIFMFLVSIIISWWTIQDRNSDIEYKSCLRDIIYVIGDYNYFFKENITNSTKNKIISELYIIVNKSDKAKNLYFEEISSLRTEDDFLFSLLHFETNIKKEYKEITYGKIGYNQAPFRFHLVIFWIHFIIIVFYILFRFFICNVRLEEKNMDIYSSFIISVGSICYEINKNDIKWAGALDEVLGYSIKDVNNDINFINTIVHPDDIQIRNDALEKCVSNRRVSKVKYRIRKNNGEYIWVLERVLCIEAAPLKQIGVIVDIDPYIKEGEISIAENRRLKEQNNSLEQFAYIASHDLQEPVRKINSFISLIKSEADKDKIGKDIMSYIDIIDRSADFMAQLVRALLFFSRVGKNIKMENVKVDELIKDVINDLSKEIKETNATIQYGSMPEIFTDKFLLFSVIKNIVGNSLKYHKDGVAPEIVIDCDKIENSWIFSINDNGIGIEEKFYGRVFQPFQRLKSASKKKGSGIGLTICKKIIEEIFKGKIWIESVVGVGTTFYFTIPKGKNEQGL